MPWVVFLFLARVRTFVSPCEFSVFECVARTRTVLQHHLHLHLRLASSELASPTAHRHQDWHLHLRYCHRPCSCSRSRSRSLSFSRFWPPPLSQLAAPFWRCHCRRFHCQSCPNIKLYVWLRGWFYHFLYVSVCGSIPIVWDIVLIACVCECGMPLANFPFTFLSLYFGFAFPISLCPSVQFSLVSFFFF